MQDQAESGIVKIKVLSTQVLKVMVHPVVVNILESEVLEVIRFWLGMNHIFYLSGLGFAQHCCECEVGVLCLRTNITQKPAFETVFQKDR